MRYSLVTDRWTNGQCSLSNKVFVHLWVRNPTNFKDNVYILVHTLRSYSSIISQPQDLQYPCSMLEMMRRCWSNAPEQRPSAAALTALCAAPEYLALLDAAAAGPSPPRPAPATAAPIRARHSHFGSVNQDAVCSNVSNNQESGLSGPAHQDPAWLSLANQEAAWSTGGDGEGWEVWYGGSEPERAHSLLASGSGVFTHHHTLRVPPGTLIIYYSRNSIIRPSVIRIRNYPDYQPQPIRLNIYIRK